MKHFYKGETLDIVFTTPVPEAPAVRATITGFVISATIQGLVPLVEPIDEYSFRLFLSEAQSQKLINPEVPIVITMKKDGVVKIGRNIDLVCVDPRVGVATEPLDDPTAMVLNMATGDISFTLDLKQLPTSPYQMWLVANPAGTVEQFLAFLQKPASDFVATAQASIDSKEATENKVSEIPAEPTGGEFPDLTLMSAELAKKEDTANKVSAIPAEPTGNEFPDLELMQAEDAKKMDIVAAPATATSPGKAGTIVIAGGFIYVCVATDTWERAALVTATWE